MADDNELLFQMKMQDQMSGVLQGIEGSFKDVASVVQQQMAAMQQLTAALQAQAGGAKAATSAAQAHAAGIKAVGEAIKSATADTKSHEAATKSSTSAHGEHAEAMKKGGEAAREAAEQNKSLAGRLGEVTSTAKEAVEAMIALYASNEMAKASIEASEELEHTIRDIGAAAGVSRDQVKELLESLNKQAGGKMFADQAEGLAKIGATLTSSTEQMEAFALALGKISNTGNFQQIGNSIAQLLAQTNEGPEKVEALADALGKLGLSTRGGVEGLTEISNSIARFTAGMAMSSTKVVGYAATFAKSFQPEQARMAAAQFGMMLQTIDKQARDGGDGLKDLAGRLGMTYEEMRKLGQAHPDEVFQKLLQVTNAIKSSGGNPADFLKQFGLGDGRALQQIEALSEHYRDLQKNIDDAQNATGGADAFNKEKLTDYDNAVRELSNAWKELKEQFGGAFTDVAIEGFKATTVAIKELTAGFSALPDSMKTVIASLVILAPALGGVGLSIGVFVRAFREAKDGFVTLAASLSELGSRSGAAALQVEQSAAKMEGAAHGAANAERSVATAAKETEAAVKLSWSNMALAVGTYMVAADAAHELGLGIAGLIQQQQQFGKQGISWTDEALGLGAMLPSWMGGDGYKSALKDSMYVEKRKRDGEKGSGGEEHEHKSEAHSEAHSEEHAKPQTPNTVGSQGAATDFSARNMLADFSPAIKAAKDYADAVEHLQTAIEKMDGATKAALASEIQGAQQALELRRAELDPLNKMTDQWRQAMMAAQAYTAVQKEAAETEAKVFDARQEQYKLGHGDAGADRAEAQVRQQQGALNNAKRDNDYTKEAQGLQQALAMAAALTQADKDRLAVDQQIANLARDKTYTQAQLDQLKQILELTKQIERENQQFAALNPQAKALQDYNDQLKTLQQRFPQGGDEFNREKTRLDNDTLAQRSPVGKIAQDQSDEIAQAQIVGKYHDADLKTLQQITQLKREGAISDDASGKAIQNQIGANNRLIQDIKDRQQELQQIADSFSSGLSNAISGALSGNRHAFSQFGLQMGKTLMDMAFKDLGKQLMPSLNSLLGGSFDAAKKGTDALGGLAKAQEMHTIASAQQSITQATITIANATIAAGLPQTPGGPGGGLPGGLPGPSGTNLPGSAGAPGSLAQVVAPTVPKVSVAGADNSPLPSGAATFDPETGKWSTVGGGATSPITPPSFATPGGANSASTFGGLSKVPFGLTDANVQAGQSSNADMVKALMGVKPALDPNAPYKLTNAGIPFRASPAAGLNGDMQSMMQRFPNTFEGRTAAQEYFAQKYGVNPELAKSIAYHEGNNTYAKGPNQASITDMKNGKPYSFGDYQLNMHKGAAGDLLSKKYGLDPNSPDFYLKSDEASIKYMRENGFQPWHGDPGLEAWGNKPRLTKPDPSKSLSTLQSPGSAAKGAGGFTQYGGGLSVPKRPGDDGDGTYAMPHSPGADVKNLNPQFADRIQDLQQDAADQGIPSTLISGYRSPALQAKLYANYQARQAGQPLPYPESGQGGMAAAPGGSHHNFGQAADIVSPQQDKLNQMAAQPWRKITPGAKFGDADHYQTVEPNGAMPRNQGIDTTPTGSINTALKQMQDQSTSQLQAAMQSATKVQDTMKTSLTQSSQAFTSNFGSLASGIKETGSTALGAVPDMGSFSSSIEQMVSKLGSGGGGGGLGGLGSLFGGGGGGGFGDMGDFGAFHSGGKVGSPAGGYLHRNISVAAFRGAPKFHDGLNSDEFPAVLQRGERVLTNAQEQKTTSIVDRLADAVNNKSTPGSPRATPAAQRAAGSRVNMVVNVKDANSFRLSQSQIMAQAHSAMMRTSAKHN